LLSFISNPRTLDVAWIVPTRYPSSFFFLGNMLDDDPAVLLELREVGLNCLDSVRFTLFPITRPTSGLGIGAGRFGSLAWNACWARNDSGRSNTGFT
jgi:hypothetical protein